MGREFGNEREKRRKGKVRDGGKKSNSKVQKSRPHDGPKGKVKEKKGKKQWQVKGQTEEKKSRDRREKSHGNSLPLAQHHRQANWGALKGTLMEKDSTHQKKAYSQGINSGHLMTEIFLNSEIQQQ
jgi:hypothetical protein